MTTAARLAASLLLTALAAAAAQAQVFRCGDSTLFTDKPCEGATEVDVRANILDAGPRWLPPPESLEPKPAIILPDTSRRAPASPSGPSVWERRDRAEAEYRQRTGPFR
jgi:hypothetical protein